MVLEKVEIDIWADAVVLSPLEKDKVALLFCCNQKEEPEINRIDLFLTGKKILQCTVLVFEFQCSAG